MKALPIHACSFHTSLLVRAMRLLQREMTSQTRDVTEECMVCGTTDWEQNPSGICFPCQKYDPNICSLGHCYREVPHPNSDMCREHADIRSTLYLEGVIQADTRKLDVDICVAERAQLLRAYARCRKSTRCLIWCLRHRQDGPWRDLTPLFAHALWETRNDDIWNSYYAR